MGLILIPSVTAFAECLTAVSVAAQDQTTLAMAVAIGSAIQTLTFVIPCVVLLGWAIDRPVGLLFDPFESIVLYLSVATMSSVVGDGRSNWMEGVILVCQCLAYRERAIVLIEIQLCM
jgi:Ca2+:H+ antiporter